MKTKANSPKSPLAVLAFFALVGGSLAEAEVLPSETHNIVTIAGISYDPIGDDGPATSAQFNNPRGVVFDSLGSLYIADGLNHRIRKVDTDGTITTVAGTGVSGFSGDDGPATEAQIAGPFDVTFDSVGNLYVAEVLNNRIRKIDTHGFITTVAGTGIGGFNGDNQPSTLAQLNVPFEVTVDPSSGNMYISDTSNNRIRFVNLTNHPVPLPGHPEQIVDPGAITTIVGIGGVAGFSGDGGLASAAQLSAPRGVAFDSSGNFYFTDQGNERIRKVDSNGIITTVVGTGTRGYNGDNRPATSAQINRPRVVTMDSSDNLYFADFFNNRIRKVTRSPAPPLGDGNLDGDADETVTSIAGTGLGGFSGDGGPATSAQLNNPLGVTLGAGDLYFSDSSNNRVRKITRSPDPPLGDGNINGDADESISTFAGGGIFFGGDGGPATLAQLNNPYDVASDSLGNLYLADAFNNRIRKIDTNGIITTVVGTGDAGLSGDGGPATAAQINSPQGVTFGSSDTLYVSDSGNNCIRKVMHSPDPPLGDGDIDGDADEIIMRVAGTGVAGSTGDGGLATAATLTQPRNVTFDSSGNMLIAEYNSNRIRKVDTNGFITPFAGMGGPGNFSGDGGQATLARLNNPFDVAVDSLNNVYIADRLNNRIRKVDTNGIITTFAGTGAAGYNGDNQPATSAQISNPRGVNVDSLDNLYIADNVGHRIRKVDTTGTITTVAGTGIGGFAGDGGLATSAQINGPSGMLIDDSDNLYFADTENARVRRLNLATPVVVAPDTLNITHSKGRWVTATLQFPAGWNASDVNLDSVLLEAIDPTNGAVRSVSHQEMKVPIAPGSPTELINTNGDGEPDQVTVKFARAMVVAMATGTPELVLRVEGTLQPLLGSPVGKYFSGDTPIRNIYPPNASNSRRAVEACDPGLDSCCVPEFAEDNPESCPAF